MIEFIKGDITSVTEGLIVHGTNCSGGFGSGVAGAIRVKWPLVYEIFKGYQPGKHLLGEFVPVKINDDLYVANCYTQLYFGSDGRRYASPEAIKKALTSAYKYAKEHEIKSVSLPKIGAGLGGLSWEDEVFPIVKAISANFNSIHTKIYYID